jgi:hypothetical protein
MIKLKLGDGLNRHYRALLVALSAALLLFKERAGHRLVPCVKAMHHESQI